MVKIFESISNEVSRKVRYLTILFSSEEEVHFDISSDIWPFIGRGGKSAMFV